MALNKLKLQVYCKFLLIDHLVKFFWSWWTGNTYIDLATFLFNDMYAVIEARVRLVDSIHTNEEEETYL